MVVIPLLLACGAAAAAPPREGSVAGLVRQLEDKDAVFRRRVAHDSRSSAKPPPQSTSHSTAIPTAVPSVNADDEEHSRRAEGGEHLAVHRHDSLPRHGDLRATPTSPAWTWGSWYYDEATRRGRLVRAAPRARVGDG